MPKPLRRASGGMVFHCINRGNGRSRIFEDDRDYSAFEKVLAEALMRVPLRLLAYCLMPNHWHRVLWPSLEGQSEAMMALEASCQSTGLWDRYWANAFAHRN